MHKRYLRIETIALSHLNNAEFLKLMRRVIFRIPRKASSSGGEDLPEVQSADTEEISEEVYIDQELVDELEGYLDQMDELTRETTASINTEYLQELESQRDEVSEESLMNRRPLLLIICWAILKVITFPHK